MFIFINEIGSVTSIQQVRLHQCNRLSSINATDSVASMQQIQLHQFNRLSCINATGSVASMQQVKSHQFNVSRTSMPGQQSGGSVTGER